MCTNPDAYGLVLLVSVCKREFDTDDTACILHPASCILQPHEHACLQVESYVAYRHAKIIEQAELAQDLRRGLLRQKDDIRPDVFRKVLRGIGTSLRIQPQKKAFFNDRLPPMISAA